MKASPGRIVHYVVSDIEANEVNRRRKDARAHLTDHQNAATGVIVHVGNDARDGDIYPLIVTRVWPDGRVNGQLLLDGNDNLWIMSAHQVDDEHPVGTPRYWYEPPRV